MSHDYLVNFTFNGHAICGTNDNYTRCPRIQADIEGSSIILHDVSIVSQEKNFLLRFFGVKENGKDHVCTIPPNDPEYAKLIETIVLYEGFLFFLLHPEETEKEANLKIAFLKSIEDQDLRKKIYEGIVAVLPRCAHLSTEEAASMEGSYRQLLLTKEPADDEADVPSSEDIPDESTFSIHIPKGMEMLIDHTRLIVNEVSFGAEGDYLILTIDGTDEEGDEWSFTIDGRSSQLMADIFTTGFLDLLVFAETVEEGDVAIINFILSTQDTAIRNAIGAKYIEVVSEIDDPDADIREKLTRLMQNGLREAERKPQPDSKIKDTCAASYNVPPARRSMVRPYTYIPSAG